MGRGLAARPADGALQAVGQLLVAVGAVGADGPVGVTVLGDGQSDRHVAAGVRADGDLPADVGGVAVPVQPPGPGHLAARHRERVVPQRLVAEAFLGLLAEPQLEGIARSDRGVSTYDRALLHATTRIAATICFQLSRTGPYDPFAATTFKSS